MLSGGAFQGRPARHAFQAEARPVTTHTGACVNVCLPRCRTTHPGFLLGAGCENPECQVPPLGRDPVTLNACRRGRWTLITPQPATAAPFGSRAPRRADAAVRKQVTTMTRMATTGNIAWVGWLASFKGPDTAHYVTTAAGLASTCAACRTGLIPGE